MHRDVKPSNILMDKHCGIHIIDFGLARRVSSTQDYFSEQVVAPLVISRENPLLNQPDEVLSLDSESALPSFSPPQRQLTRHIATRWYRPPEIIVLQVFIPLP